MAATGTTGRRRDHGLFGPDSVVWRVFRHPSSFTVGFQRTVVVEMFEPRLLASVVHTGAVQQRPASRYDRTLQYVATIAFGDSDQVLRAAEVLRRVHTPIRGVDPVTGAAYDANDPDLQLWIHLTQWQSVLRCYELFGGRRLSPAEDRAYWAACRTAAAFQTIDPATVPSDRGEMRRYYDHVRPTLVVTDDTRRLVELLLGDALLALAARLGRVASLAAVPSAAVLRAATIATLPGWLRELAGLRQSAVTGAAAIAAVRAALLPLTPTRPALAVARAASPATAAVVGPAVLGEPPLVAEVVTPAEVFARVGRPSIRDRYLATLDRDEVVPARAPRDAGREHVVPLG